MNQQLIYSFKKYLQIKKLSKVSIKNYLSDTRQFLKWTAKNQFGSLEAGIFGTYKSALYHCQTPVKTINRYLSSLRRFGRFLEESGLFAENPAKNLTNIQNCKDRVFTSKITGGEIHVKTRSLHIEEFREALIGEKLKPSTIKNYVSDVKQFLEFINRTCK